MDDSSDEVVAGTDLEATEAYYRVVWTGILSQLLGWPPDRITRWSNQALAGVRDDPIHAGMVFNETPEEAVAHECIPLDLRQRLRGLELVRLHQEVEAILDDNRAGKVPDDFDPITFDWTIYRPALERALARYGASLPVVQP